MLINIIFKFIATLFLFFTFHINYCQEEIVKFTQPIDFIILPNQLHETSGLIFFNGLLWTFNDSGGKPALYSFSNENGNIISYIKLKKGKNFDWEDITQDEEYIYIGDFGNNLGNRKNLRIFKIEKENIEASNKSKIDFETIYFSYKEQTNFKPTLGQTSYDCESLISYKDQLIILTKDWKDKNSTVYTISKEPGDYNLEKAHSIDINGLVTGAELFDKNKIILCGWNQISPFISFIDILDYTILKTINFPHLKGYQIEGITFDNKYLYLSSEKTAYPPCVFKIELNKIINY